MSEIASALVRTRAPETEDFWDLVVETAVGMVKNWVIGDSGIRLRNGLPKLVEVEAVVKTNVVGVEAIEGGVPVGVVDGKEPEAVSAEEGGVPGPVGVVDGEETMGAASAEEGGVPVGVVDGKEPEAVAAEEGGVPVGVVDGKEPEVVAAEEGGVPVGVVDGEETMGAAPAEEGGVPVGVVDGEETKGIGTASAEEGGVPVGVADSEETTGTASAEEGGVPMGVDETEKGIPDALLTQTGSDSPPGSDSKGS